MGLGGGGGGGRGVGCYMVLGLGVQLEGFFADFSFFRASAKGFLGFGLRVQTFAVLEYWG